MTPSAAQSDRHARQPRLVCGLNKMGKIGSGVSGVHGTPLVDRGIWQVSPLWFRLWSDRGGANPVMLLVVPTRIQWPSVYQVEFLRKTRPGRSFRPN